MNALKIHPNLPKHIAVIMDGNGRWAKSQGKPRVFGHNEGVNSVRDILDVATAIDLNHLTLYTFSTENWKRPKAEVTALMTLLVMTLKKELRNLNKRNVKVNMLGRPEDLPKDVAKTMLSAMEDTKNNTGLQLNIALSYSSRIEMTEAVKSIAESVKNGELRSDEINDELISSRLYTKDMPDPDLLIRTSGEFRISNFLLWQIAYSEIYITETLWPEFRQDEFLSAIENYVCRERRFGMVTEQLK
jgi:undecaprenyl diphosphate synthase